ncbi:MAG TPA: metallophosphoesterase [Bacillota bacterium]|jgi:predicted phosphohydrolase|nr:metallophosphoesterase [Bacillota bacterium]HPZ12222.1 metallophosphoesterase [Bacillota bacterium]
MAIWAIADLHLSHDRAKPMDIFGPCWENHAEKIAANWRRLVGGDDLVIVAGDISWAMQLSEAAADLNWIASLPGRKLLLRGNHDYWWSSISKVRAALPPGMAALQNDHYVFEDWAICGSRGWICPGEEGFDSEHDEKIYRREIGRLELSLESARLAGRERIVAALHYPPFNRQGSPSGFTGLLERYGVSYCVYGHIHDEGRDRLFQGERGGVNYIFVAADGVDFTPVRVIY